MSAVRPAASVTIDAPLDVVWQVMLDTEALDRTQLAWLDRELGRSDARWKIPVFHRPIYTSGRYSAPARIFRSVLEPLFVRHGVRVAMSGRPKSAWIISPCSVTRSVPSTEPDGCA